MNYPYVFNELNTLDKLKEGFSIARYGDGELNICLGGSSKLQAFDSDLQDRLINILANPINACLVGIPNIATNRLPERKQEFWKRYLQDQYTDLYTAKEYYSAFITRPDSAPEINNANYYNSIFSLWQDKDVLMVEGSESDFNKTHLFRNTESIQTLKCAKMNAYRDYVRILDRVLEWADRLKNPVVIISLGPTATVLANDIASFGFQALDLGHLAFLYEKCFVGGKEH